MQVYYYKFTCTMTQYEYASAVMYHCTVHCMCARQSSELFYYFRVFTDYYFFVYESCIFKISCTVFLYGKCLKSNAVEVLPTTRTYNGGH